jgi:hypothetical protein
VTAVLDVGQRRPGQRLECRIGIARQDGDGAAERGAQRVGIAESDRGLGLQRRQVVDHEVDHAVAEPAHLLGGAAQRVGHATTSTPTRSSAAVSPGRSTARTASSAAIATAS